MAKRPGRKVYFELSIGEDPSLWRFSSAQEALRANISLLSKLIRVSETGQASDRSVDAPPVEAEVSESA